MESLESSQIARTIRYQVSEIIAAVFYWLRFKFRNRNRGIDFSEADLASLNADFGTSIMLSCASVGIFE